MSKEPGLRRSGNRAYNSCQYASITLCLNGAYGIDGSTGDIQHALQNQPGETYLLFKLSDSEQRNAVQHWNNGTCTHSDKHACAKGTPLGSSEAGHNRYNRAANANEGNL